METDNEASHAGLVGEKIERTARWELERTRQVERTLPGRRRQAALPFPGVGITRLRSLRPASRPLKSDAQLRECEIFFFFGPRKR